MTLTLIHFRSVHLSPHKSSKYEWWFWLVGRVYESCTWVVRQGRQAGRRIERVQTGRRIERVPLGGIRDGGLQNECPGLDSGSYAHGASIQDISVHSKKGEKNKNYFAAQAGKQEAADDEKDDDVAFKTTEDGKKIREKRERGWGRHQRCAVKEDGHSLLIGKNRFRFFVVLEKGRERGQNAEAQQIERTRTSFRVQCSL